MKKSILTTVFSLLFGLSQTIAQEYPFEVSVSGSGTAVLLVPGFACPAAVWDMTVAELEQNYEIHVFTLAGFGDVPPITFPWLPAIKKGLERYIKDKKLKDVQFIGHSMGGTLGLWLAAENPTIFSKVVSVDGLPAMGALMFPNYDAESFSYDSEYNQQALTMDDAQFSGMANQFANGMTLNDESKPVLVEWMKQADRKTYVYGYTDLLKLDLRDALDKIEVPVTVIAATHPYGKEAVMANIKNQFCRLKDYELILAEDAAHFIMFDKPDWFNQTLKMQLGER